MSQTPPKHGFSTVAAGVDNVVRAPNVAESASMESTTASLLESISASTPSNISVNQFAPVSSTWTSTTSKSTGLGGTVAGKGVDVLSNIEQKGVFRGEAAESVHQMNKVVEDTKNIALGVNKNNEVQKGVEGVKGLVEETKSDTQLKDLLDSWQQLIIDLANIAKQFRFQFLGTIQSMMKDLGKSEELTSFTNDFRGLIKDIVMKREITEEHRQYFFDQWRRVITDLSTHPKFQELVSLGKDMKQEMIERAKQDKDLPEQTKEVAKNLTTSESAEKIKDSAKGVAANVTSESAIETTIKDTKDLWERLKVDADLYNNYFQTLLDMVILVLEDPSKLEDEKLREQFNRMFELGEFIVVDVSSKIEETIKKDIQTLLGAAKDKPEAQALMKDTENLTQSLLTGGGIQIVEQLRQALVPLLMDRIKNLRLPAIEGVGDSALGKFEYELDNIILKTEEVIPDKIKIKILNEMNFHPINMSTSNEKSKLKVHVKGINAEFNNVAWRYKRLSTPHVHDNGTVDAKLSGKGIQIWLVLKMYFTENNILVLDKDTLEVRVDKIDLDFHHTKAAGFYEFLMSIFSRRLKDRIAKEIENGIDEAITSVNNAINTVLTRAFEVQNGLVVLSKSFVGENLMPSLTNIKNIAQNVIAANTPTKLMPSSSSSSSTTSFTEKSSWTSSERSQDRF